MKKLLFLGILIAGSINSLFGQIPLSGKYKDLTLNDSNGEVILKDGTELVGAKITCNILHFDNNAGAINLNFSKNVEIRCNKIKFVIENTNLVTIKGENFSNVTIICKQIRDYNLFRIGHKENFSFDIKEK